MSETCTPQRPARDLTFVEQLHLKQLNERYESFPPVETV
jgi:hypothetical protein